MCRLRYDESVHTCTLRCGPMRLYRMIAHKRPGPGLPATLITSILRGPVRTPQGRVRRSCERAERVAPARRNRSGAVSAVSRTRPTSCPSLLRAGKWSSFRGPRVAQVGHQTIAAADRIPLAGSLRACVHRHPVVCVQRFAAAYLPPRCTRLRKYSAAAAGFVLRNRIEHNGPD